MHWRFCVLFFSLHVFSGNGLKISKVVFPKYLLSNDGLDFLATISAEYVMWI